MKSQLKAAREARVRRIAEEQRQRAEQANREFKTPAQQIREFDRQIEEEKLAPARQVAREQQALLRQLAAAERETIFEQPDDNVPAGTKFDANEHHRVTPEQFTAKIKAAGEKWQSLASNEFEISPDAIKRLHRYAFLNELDLTKVEVWEKAFRRLLDINAFDDLVAAKQKQEVEPEQTFDALLKSTNGETREGQRILREAVSRELFGGPSGELKRTYDGWLESMRAAWEFVPNAKQEKAAIQWFLDNNENFTGARDSYNRCRRALSKNGTFPPMFTPEELLADEVSRTGMNANELVQRQNELKYR